MSYLAYSFSWPDNPIESVSFFYSSSHDLHVRGDSRNLQSTVFSTNKRFECDHQHFRLWFHNALISNAYFGARLRANHAIDKQHDVFA